MQEQTVLLPQIWGGLECTINRVDNTFHDQFAQGGIYDNCKGLEAVAGLGIKTLRFPLLWEKHQTSEKNPIDWNWAHQQLNFLEEEGIEPVIGLLHHGSGPAFTNLLDENFPSLFANYAAQVAHEFPRLTYYTPVNEPLTTARFSGLYGLWYPHKENDVSFIKMLINELKATVLAMQAIRRVNPNAKLIQTEDLSKTYSSPVLSYQADFENHRRWLTFDILTGIFNEMHPLWNYFMRLGINPATMQFFLDNPTPPDICGVNYYATSERYLDDNIEWYPDINPGGNTLHTYVDVEALRVPLTEPNGIGYLLTEIWERYKLPLVITEVHLHCTREEQLRWFHHIYDECCQARNQGIDIKAVTAWAMFGSFGWDKLLTSFPGNYELGAFDISSGYFRPTAIAKLIKTLIAAGEINNALAKQHGWWKRDSRFYYINKLANPQSNLNTQKPVLIIGDTGTLGRAFAHLCTLRNIVHLLVGRNTAELGNIPSLEAMILKHKPWAIINAAGFVKVDEAERQKDLCFGVNSTGVKNLAVLCSNHNVKLLCFSSDLVFDGTKGSPYTEDDQPNPLNVYGRSKQIAEDFLVNIYRDALMVRTSAFFGPWDEHNFVHHLLRELENGSTVSVSADIIVSPTYVPHLVNASLDLLIDGASGIWHLANKGEISWFEFAKMFALRAGLDADLITPVYDQETAAARPVNSALSSIKYNLMPTLENAVKEYFNHRSYSSTQPTSPAHERI